MTKEEIKRLVERYPYLKPRNVWTGKVPEDYDYSYIRGIGEIPEGWNKLFLQMCEDIRQPLIDANFLGEFTFSQIKEKYGELCCYHLGAPEIVCSIIDKYEAMSGYVCASCGKPAMYVTQGYILPYCEDCVKDIVRYEPVERVEFKPYFKRTVFDKKGSWEEVVSFEDAWKRYLEGLRYD